MTQLERHISSVARRGYRRMKREKVFDKPAADTIVWAEMSNQHKVVVVSYNTKAKKLTAQYAYLTDDNFVELEVEV